MESRRSNGENLAGDSMMVLYISELVDARLTVARTFFQMPILKCIKFVINADYIDILRRN